MNRMKKQILVSLLLLFSLLAVAQKNANDVVGVFYAPDGVGKIEIYERNGKYFGKTTCCDTHKRDVYNPDPSKRNRAVIGMEFMFNFEWDGKGTYQNGRLYNPEDGRTYNCKMWLIENGKKLRMRGYWGLSAFGKTVTFQRV